MNNLAETQQHKQNYVILPKQDKYYTPPKLVPGELLSKFDCRPKSGTKSQGFEL